MNKELLKFILIVHVYTLLLLYDHCYYSIFYLPRFICSTAYPESRLLQSCLEPVTLSSFCNVSYPHSKRSGRGLPPGHAQTDVKTCSYNYHYKYRVPKDFLCAMFDFNIAALTSHLYYNASDCQLSFKFISNY